MPFETLNLALFQLINASATPAAWIVLIARIFAQWVIFGMVLWMVIMWIRTNTRSRFVLLDSLLTAIIALGIGQIIRHFWYHPRPFEIHLGHQLLDHKTVTSFPSDHGLFMYAIALSFLISHARRALGWLLLLIGTGVAWSRVYLGIHFPFDMIGAIVVAAICAGFVNAMSPRLRPGIYSLAIGLYEATISSLKLPGNIFPRANWSAPGKFAECESASKYRSINLLLTRTNQVQPILNNLSQK